MLYKNFRESRSERHGQDNQNSAENGIHSSPDYGGYCQSCRPGSESSGSDYSEDSGCSKTGGDCRSAGRKSSGESCVSRCEAVIASTKALVSAILAGGWIVVLILLIVILFGALFSMVGGSNSSTVTPVSAEVEAYEPLIRQYARQYGIEEYVELIKAVMMQESGGQGTDPMQRPSAGIIPVIQIRQTGSQIRSILLMLVSRTLRPVCGRQAWKVRWI